MNLVLKLKKYKNLVFSNLKKYDEFLERTKLACVNFQDSFK